MGNFLHKLQVADSQTKFKVLMVSSLAITVVVVCVWLLYFNNLVASAGDEHAPQIGSVSGGENVSFLGTMWRGAAVLYGNFSGMVQWMGDVFRAPKEYIVKPME